MKQKIIRLLLELSVIDEPNLYIVQAIQLLTSALIILEFDMTTASLLYSRAQKLLSKGKRNNNADKG